MWGHYLASEYATVEPDVPGNVDKFDICGDLLTHADLYEVTGDECGGGHGDLFAVAEYDDVRGKHTLDRGHDARRGEVLPCIEDCLEHDDDKQHDRER